MDSSIDDEAEELLRIAAHSLTDPAAGECLPCYLDRMLHEASCDGSLRFAKNYRDATAPRATALERRLHMSGACCDCEVLMNVYSPLTTYVVACDQVRRGSTQPCRLWARRWRGMRW